jgi:Family of unknown function (DUF6114)
MPDVGENTDSAGHDPAESAGQRPDPGSPTESAASPVRQAWRGWRAWRRSRPFWGGLLLAAAGAELLLIPLPMNSMGLILHIGTGGVLGILIGALLIVCALLIWFNPGQRMFYSIVAVLVSIAALIASNLGGFLIGTLLGVIGGSLAFAWMPGPETAGSAEPRRRRWSRPSGRHDASLTGLSLVLGGTAGRGPAAADPDPANPDPANTDPAGGEAEDADDPEPGGTAGADDLTLPALPAQSAPDPEHGGRGTIYHGLPVLGLVLGLVTGVLHGGSSGSVPGTCTASPAATASAQPHPSAAPTASPSPGPSCPSPSPSPTGSGPASPAPTGSPRPHPGPTGRPGPGPTKKPGKVKKQAAAPSGLVVAAVPSNITANRATLTGLSYDGVASVPTASGTQQMLKFTMSGLTLSGADDLTVTEGGHTLSIKASSLSFTGNVTLLCTKIHGDLLGVPLTFTPQTPPPLVLPVMVFTKVTTYQPVTTADSLQIGGLLIEAS